MFRLAGAGGSTDKAAVEEERKKNRQNVWFTMKVFVAYVALLRIGKIKTYVYMISELKRVLLGLFSKLTVSKNIKQLKLL